LFNGQICPSIFKSNGKDFLPFDLGGENADKYAGG
jgi:hypothetical protein